MIWYKMTTFNDDIELLEVVKETPHTVTAKFGGVAPKRVQKEGGYYFFGRTKKEVLEKKLKRMRSKASTLHFQISSEEMDLARQIDLINAFREKFEEYLMLKPGTKVRIRKNDEYKDVLLRTRVLSVLAKNSDSSRLDFDPTLYIPDESIYGKQATIKVMDSRKNLYVVELEDKSRVNILPEFLEEVYEL